MAHQGDESRSGGTMVRDQEIGWVCDGCGSEFGLDHYLYNRYSRVFEGAPCPMKWMHKECRGTVRSVGSGPQPILGDASGATSETGT